MNIESYKLKPRQWFNRRKNYKQSMKVMHSIVYGQCTDTIKQKLYTLPAFAPIKDKQDHESAILILEIIKSICYNFEVEKKKVLAVIQTYTKATSWRNSEGLRIAEYNDQFMN